MPAASAPVTAPDAKLFSQTSGVLTAIGCCVLIAWLVVSIARPSKLKLRNTPNRPNSLQPVLFLALLLFWLGAMAVAAASIARFIDQDDPRFSTIAGLICQPLQLAGCLVVAALTFRHGIARGLGLSGRRWLHDSARAVVSVLAVWPVCFGLLWLMARFIPHEPHDLLRAMEALAPPWRVLAVFSAVVLAPLSEEVFFRGILQSLLRKHTRRPWTAILISSAVFALVHFTVPTSVVPLFALAVVLGYNYERTGRLFAPLLIHGVFNALNIVDFLSRS